ncbi:hypothetical protein WG70_09155 [Burkholderia oklahomensis EO147]|nr:hypothetical protein WG70_09155 [Burkholderia oklahomensis EO147]KUY67687.1 hypothetical protein WG70_25910 [Burkholderia oklahomensis EO147]
MRVSERRRASGPAVEKAPPRRRPARPDSARRRSRDASRAEAFGVRCRYAIDTDKRAGRRFDSTSMSISLSSA